MLRPLLKTLGESKVPSKKREHNRMVVHKMLPRTSLLDQVLRHNSLLAITPIFRRLALLSTLQNHNHKQLGWQVVCQVLMVRQGSSHHPPKHNHLRLLQQPHNLHQHPPRNLPRAQALKSRLNPEHNNTLHLHLQSILPSQQQLQQDCLLPAHQHKTPHAFKPHRPRRPQQAHLDHFHTRRRLLLPTRAGRNPIPFPRTRLLIKPRLKVLEAPHPAQA